RPDRSAGDRGRTSAPEGRLPGARSSPPRHRRERARREAARAAPPGQDRRRALGRRHPRRLGRQPAVGRPRRAGPYRETAAVTMLDWIVIALIVVAGCILAMLLSVLGGKP